MDGQTQKGLSFMSLKYVGPNFLYIVGQMLRMPSHFLTAKGQASCFSYTLWIIVAFYFSI